MSPDESAALDRQLAEMIRRWHRLRWMAAAALALILTAAIVYLAVALLADQARIAASCHVWADIGAAPLAAGPDGKASELGTSLISDSRQAWHGQHCPGQLPPPQPSFVKWAKVYGLPHS